MDSVRDGDLAGDDFALRFWFGSKALRIGHSPLRQHVWRHLVLAASWHLLHATAGVLGWGISLGSIGFSICFSLLELLVAFLQAYIFTFLAALFIGSAQHAH
jgi:hypothetical protein